MKNITLTDIDVFAENYNIPENKELEKLITKQGINKALLDKKIIAENPFEFNVELPSYHHYDQLKSGRCWCFSSVNMIEGNIIENMNINPEELSLSINYFTFFDKLEKTNFIYNYIIENKTDIEYLNQTIINDNYGNLIEGSYYTDFANIVNKYGIVPSKAMEETIDTNNSEKFIILWREKVKRDCLDILEKKSKLSIIKLYELKKQKLNDMYCFLSKISGQPPLKFNYEYNDKYGNLITLENITPQEFKKRYLTINLEDFVFIVSNPNLDYYKKYYKEFSSDNSKQPYLEFINLPKEILKSLTIKQLKNKMPVKFGCRIKIAPHSEINILDTRILDLQKLGIDLLDYQNGIKAKTITSEHGMTFEGVHLENEKPVRWKVENSHHKYSNQFFIMNDNYFDKNVITVNIHKSFLSKKQLEILKSKAIKVSNNEIT